MAKVLKLERFGINDDFYELGGDSLGSIKVITESELPGLNASEIFRGRTPKKIAALYEESHANDDGEAPELKNARAMKVAHPLTAEQLYMVDYQLYTPKSTMYNLFTMMKLDKELFDMQKMADAMHTAIRNHSALLTTFDFNDDGEIVQHYTPEVLADIHVEKLSEFEKNGLGISVLLYCFPDDFDLPFKFCHRLLWSDEWEYGGDIEQCVYYFHNTAKDEYTKSANGCKAMHTKPKKKTK